MSRQAGWTALAPLFLVSMATVGFEIALTRYFAVAKWSEYGYWVISIVLAGFALSGVLLALAREQVARHGGVLLAVLPALLVVAASIGFHFVTSNPFNPLQLQNPATFWPQLGLIGGYYAALLPFFFLAGVFVSLSFVLHDRELGRVYGYDLTGAGAGALLAMALMEVVHPFNLLACLLVPLAAASVFSRRWRLALPAALLALIAGEAMLLLDNTAAFNDFKAIYAPLHVPGAKVLSTTTSARGYYMLLDDFTERVDTDLSNDTAILGLPGPPSSWGLYRDGNRIAALPRPGPIDARYAGATLDALPYQLKPHASVLLLGSAGGFAAAEARALGADSVTTIEPEPRLRALLRQPARGASPLLAARTGVYDLIDISGDFLDTAEANTSAFAAEAIAADIRAVGLDGIVSIPVSIREFPAYAVRMLATVRLALVQAGLPHPEQHVLVYRSAWNVRILVSPAPFGPRRIAIAQRFCADRSFDLSYYPGVEQAGPREIFNDLPAVNFAEGEVTSGETAHDAIADEAPAVLRGRSTASSREFNLSPITFDRPSFYAVLKLSHLGTILKRLEILPQAEIGPLVNLAVLAQAIVVALLVLAVPLLGGRRVRPAGGAGLVRGAVYFASLGLGFLFIELYLIERASFYLNDRTAGFSLVLTAMLIFSGLGSMLSGRYATRPARAATIAICVILTWCAIMLLFQQSAILATLGQRFAVRAGLVVLVTAPVSIALGLPFPLGLGRAGPGGFMPWAWGLNGAFSVVSTPLANLIALQLGYSAVLQAAFCLYVVAQVAFPRFSIRAGKSVP